MTRYSTICSSEKQKEKLLPGVHFRRLATGTIARERCQWKTPRPILKWEHCARETLHPFLLLVWLGHLLFTWMEFFKKTFEAAVVVKTLRAILLHLYQKAALSPQRHWRTLAKNIMYFCDLFHQSWWQWRKLFRHDLLTWLFSKLCTAHIRSIDLSADKVGWYD